MIRVKVVSCAVGALELAAQQHIAQLIAVRIQIEAGLIGCPIFQANQIVFDQSVLVERDYLLGRYVETNRCERGAGTLNRGPARIVQ